MARHAEDNLASQGFISKIDRPINLILGYNTEVPADLDQERTLVIGDCSKKHRETAKFFFPGCPHIAGTTTIAEVIKSLVLGEDFPDFSYLPYSLRPILNER